MSFAFVAKGIYVYMKKISNCFLLLTCLLIIACSSSPSINLDGIKFIGRSFVYDGSTHSIYISGSIPSGCYVEYKNNQRKDVGTNKAEAYIYDSKNNVIGVFEANLTIAKAKYDMTGVYFENKTFEFDNTPQSIYVTGQLPDGVTVSYDGNAKSELGTHEVTAYFTGNPNYEDILSLKAKMFIVNKIYDLSGISFNSTTFPYDGSEHKLLISGQLPDELSVRYEDNTLSDVGSQDAIAIIYDEYGNTVAEYKATLVVSNYYYELQQLKFSDLTVPYDGNEHEIKLEGAIPQGVDVVISGNRMTNPGISYAVASFYVNGELVKILNAELTILKGYYDISELNFQSKSFVYDETYHILNVENLPNGINVEYTKNALRDVGSIEVTATFSSDYYDLSSVTRKATLTVKPFVFDKSMDSNDVVLIASDDLISINIKSKIANSNQDDKYNIVSMKAWQYLSDDNYDGMSDLTENSNGTIIATIDSDFVGEYRFSRYDSEQYDGIYCKYYITDTKNKIVDGPYFVSNICPEPSHNTTVLPSSKKGLCISATTKKAISETKAKSFAINVIINGLILAEDNGNSISFNSNGKDYYFDRKTVEELDNVINGSYGSFVPSACLILYMQPSIAGTEQACSVLKYPDAQNSSTVWAVNTAQEQSTNYWIATIEFLAERYSRVDGKYGHVSQFVIGNEIDKAYEWNSICNFVSNPLSIDVYAQEYERTLRLANNAVKKYCSSMKVYSSFTYFWNQSLETNKYGAFAPHDLLDKINFYSKKMGDYNWGICFHPYAIGWGEAYDVVRNDTERIYKKSAGVSGDINNTKIISLVNLEVMNEYACSDEVRCNGLPRTVIVNEAGVSCDNSEEEIYQALSIAWAYYKICTLSSFVSYNYGAVIDSQAIYNQGLIYDTYQKKKSFDIYSSLDSKDSLEDTNELLKYASYYDIDTGDLIGDFTSFVDYMDVVKSGFDFKSNWSIFQIIAADE